MAGGDEGAREPTPVIGSADGGVVVLSLAVAGFDQCRDLVGLHGRV